jgi:membrane associated rhomboid family serine protease
MSQVLEKIRYHVRTADTLQRLIGINVLVFAVLRLTHAFGTLFMYPVTGLEFTKEWLAVPAYLMQLLVKPWTIISYMFTHWDFMHLLMNMLMLFWFGRILNEYLGAKKLLATYILGGVSGAIVFILAFNLLPYFNASVKDAVAIGASAATMAIMMASATLLPDYTLQLLLFGSVKLKWLASIVFFIDLINISADNAGGHIAHIGGAFYGVFFILALRKGIDISGWLQLALGRSTSSSAYRTPSRSSKSSDTSYLKSKKVKQEKLDAILDKISQSGYGSLTQQERDFLFKASKEE